MLDHVDNVLRLGDHLFEMDDENDEIHEDHTLYHDEVQVDILELVEMVLDMNELEMLEMDDEVQVDEFDEIKCDQMDDEVGECDSIDNELHEQHEQFQVLADMVEAYERMVAE